MFIIYLNTFSPRVTMTSLIPFLAMMDLAAASICSIVSVFEFANRSNSVSFAITMSACVNNASGMEGRIGAVLSIVLAF